MLIKDLKEEYPLVYEAALKEQANYGNNRDENKHVSALGNNGGWNWNNGIYKRFWANINNKKFDEAAKVYPELFLEAKKVRQSFKVGDKVKIPKVPKTAGNVDTNTCSAINNAKNKNQDFLYIVDFFDGSDIATLSSNMNSRDSKFYIKDLELYEEPKQEDNKIDLRNTKIYLKTKEENLDFQRFAVKNGVKYTPSEIINEEFYSTKDCFIIDERLYFGYQGYDDYYRKHSNKELFLADLLPEKYSKRKQEEIKPWSVGTYGVLLNKNSKYGRQGLVDKIINNHGSSVTFEKYQYYNIKDLSCQSGDEFRWFATKAEAEEFSRALLLPEVDYWERVKSYPNLTWDIAEDSKSDIHRQLDKETTIWNPYSERLFTGMNKDNHSRSLDSFLREMGSDKYGVVKEIYNSTESGTTFGIGYIFKIYQNENTWITNRQGNRIPKKNIIYFDNELDAKTYSRQLIDYNTSKINQDWRYEAESLMFGRPTNNLKEEVKLISKKKKKLHKQVVNTNNVKLK